MPLPEYDFHTLERGDGHFPLIRIQIGFFSGGFRQPGLQFIAAGTAWGDVQERSWCDVVLWHRSQPPIDGSVAAGSLWCRLCPE
ncbi:MAG: hypothetical protein KatS3mg110_3873 [Pirellulaceae bacterium]|nr:MAG: hypothetical protein KatS3mg110_3873 [Pirellulaceae bacterium]